jgi:hypothetical protein
MSDTPRTDKETGISIGSDSIVYASFARQLERELAAVTEQRDRAQCKIENQAKRIKYLEGATNHATGTPLSKMQEQRDRLAEALREIADCDFVITLPDRMDAVRAIAREALGDIKWHKL